MSGRGELQGGAASHVQDDSQAALVEPVGCTAKVISNEFTIGLEYLAFP